MLKRIWRQIHTQHHQQYHRQHDIPRFTPAQQISDRINKRYPKKSHQTISSHQSKSDDAFQSIQTNPINQSQQHLLEECTTSDQLISLLSASHSSSFLESVIERLITLYPQTLSPNQFAYLVHVAHRRTSSSSSIAVKTYEAMLLKYPNDARSLTMMRYALPIYARQQMYEQVIKLYDHMQDVHYKLDAVLLGIVLHACSKVHDHQTAITLYNLYRDDADMIAQSRLSSLSFVADRVRHSSLHTNASSRYISMSTKTPFNLIHFTHLVVALYDSDNVSYCVEIVQQLHAYDIEPDLFFYTSVLYTLSSRSLWHESLEIMNDMLKHNVEIDEYCYYYAMLSCAGAGSWQRSFSLMEECRHRGLEMVPQLYEAALITAETACLYSRTRSLVEEMVMNKVQCSVEGYHSLIRQAHIQRDWHWCIRLYSTVMYSPQYHTNPVVNDYVLHSAHELNPRALPRSQRYRTVSLHDPLGMTMDELFRFRFDTQGLLGPLGWWMLARPFLRTLRERGDSRKHCEQHTLGLTKYLLRAIRSSSGPANSIGCFPIHRIADKRVVQGIHERNTRVFELTLSTNRLDESIAALDLIMYVVYYQSHCRHWPRECREAIKALPFAHDEIIVKCADKHQHSQISDHSNRAMSSWSENSSGTPFSDYTIMAPSEIDKVLWDPLGPVDAGDDVGENLRCAVYRAWLTMKRMFTAQQTVHPSLGEVDIGQEKVDLHHVNVTSDFGDSAFDVSSDFRAVMMSHLHSEYSIVGELMDDRCCFKLQPAQLIAWVKREEAGRLRRMVEFNQTKLADNLKKTAVTSDSDTKLNTSFDYNDQTAL